MRGIKCRGHLKCDHYGLRGHTVDECRKLQRMDSAYNYSNKCEHKNGPSRVNRTEAGAPFTLTTEQYQHIMTLLAGNNLKVTTNHTSSTTHMSDFSGTIFCTSTNSRKIDWILDTGGATDPHGSLSQLIGNKIYCHK